MQKKSLTYLIIFIFALLLSGCNSRAYLFGVTDAISEDSCNPLVSAVTPGDATATVTPAPTFTPIPFHLLGFTNLNDHSSNLCVRVGPDTTYPVIGAIAHGVVIRVFTDVDGWYEIEFDSQVGYCSADYVIIDNDLSSPANPKYCIMINNFSGLELRELPDGNYEIGDDVDITGDGITDGVAVDKDNNGVAEAAEIMATDDLVDMTYYAPEINHNIVLATADNQFNKAIYTSYMFILQREVGDALIKAEEIFNADGYSIKVYDAYRAYIYQEVLLSLTGDSKFFNNSETGSNHNRGCAVDMTLIDANGNELEMPSKVLQFDESAYRSNVNMSEKAKENLDYMTSVMASCGFYTYEYEWWHFNYINAKNYPLSMYDDDKMIKIRLK